MNWRKSVILKKTVRYGFNTIRKPCNWVIDKNKLLKNPPILANSFPKSGTHLLIQILQAIPDIRDWGLFLASTPSFSFREITEEKMARKILGIVPNELVSAHMFYSEKVAKALAQKNGVHFFIYRDPRDIVISEAHYLTQMNTWHRLHKYFKTLPDINSRIMFSITGAIDPNFPYDYPNIAARFNRYKRWIGHPEVFSLRFEDLIQVGNEALIKQILHFYVQKSGKQFDLNNLAEKAVSNINPKNSHTFREGKCAAWKGVFTKEHKEVFKKYAGQLLIDLGYEQNHDW